MKKFLFFFLLLMGTMVSQAYDFSAVAPTGQTLYYNISGTTATVTYPGTSASTQYSGYPAPTGALSIPETVTDKGNTYSVTSIGGYAFYYCIGLTSVTIPNSVTSIGGFAFYYCSSLTSVTIPNSVTSIGYWAFYGCSGLTSVTIPNSVTSIGSSAFADCSGLTSVTIPNSVTSIGYEVFSGCSGLTSVTIPNSVTSIGYWAFHGCSGLTSVTIPNSVTSIGSSAFADCSGLTSVTIPSSVTSIGSSAFAHCSGLTSVTIPNSVTSIGERAFSGCSGLTSVTIGNSVASIGNHAFGACSNVDTLYYNARNLTTDSYWYSSTSDYNSYGFRPMTNLTVLVIGDSVQTIPAGAFYNQSHLTSVTIPNSVTSIEDYAFRGCGGLSDVFCENNVAPTLGSNVFLYTNLQAIHVPCSGYESYMSRWRVYSELIAMPNSSFNRVIEVSDTARGSVSLLSLSCQDITIMQAIPNYGYHFTQWSDGVTDNPRTFVLTQDTAFTAEFGYNQYTITGTCADSVMGSTVGDSTVDYLQYVTLTAVPNYGYHFTQWNDRNRENPRTVQALEDKNYTAQFTYNTYTIDKLCDNVKGRISGNSSSNYLSNVTLTAVPNHGYHFTQWSDGVTDNPRTFVLTQDTSFTAEFDYNQYTITGTSADSVMGSTVGDSTVDYLQYVTLTAIPNYGYHFTQWSDGNTENPRTVQALEDKNYTAQFTYNTYTITKLCDNVKGRISGNSSSDYLSNVTFTAIPNYGYHFTQWSDGDTNNPRTFVLTQDTVFTAEFDYNQYTISVLSENGTLGTVTGGGDFLYLDTVTLTATAVDHYHFARWQDGNTENPRAVVVTGDASYTAMFEIDVYHITVESSDLNMGYVSGGGDVTYGQPVTVEATAYSGYHFSCWSNGNRYNPYTFASIQDLTLQAIFISDEAPFYTITVAANNAAMGGATGSGTYDAGTVALISAVPSEGCAFLHWNDGSTEAERLVEINATATYTAFFAPEQCSVNTTTNMAAAGTVSGNGTYNMGDTVTLTATANDGYRFDHWSDGSTDEVRTVVIDENLSAEMQLGAGNTYGITFTAYFVDEHEGIDDAALDEVKVYVAEGAIIVAAAENEQVRIYDLSGRIVAEGRIEGTFRYEAPTSGVYFVRANNRKAQKVVVVK